jgi:hypothetical protein
LLRQTKPGVSHQQEDSTYECRGIAFLNEIMGDLGEANGQIQRRLAPLEIVRNEAADGALTGLTTLRLIPSKHGSSGS